MEIYGVITEVDSDEITVRTDTDREISLVFDYEQYNINPKYLCAGQTVYAKVKETLTDLYECEGCPIISISRNVDDVINCFPDLEPRKNIYIKVYTELMEFYEEDIDVVYASLHRFAETFFHTRKMMLTELLDVPLTEKEQRFFYTNWFNKITTVEFGLLGIRRPELYKTGVDFGDLRTKLLEDPYTLSSLDYQKWVQTLQPRITPEDKICMKAAEYIYQTCLSQQHVGLSISRVLGKFKGSGEDFIVRLVEKFHFKIFKHPEHGLLICHGSLYKLSKFFSEYIVDLLYDDPIYTIPPEDIFYDDSLTKKQAKAVQMALTKNVSIITGGAGTGKTRTIGQIVDNLKANNIDYHVMTFTGKASSRVKALIGAISSTIHRTLANIPRIYHLIVDETSMTEIALFMRFIRKANANLVRFKITFVGDFNQLEPIGLGSFFEELVKSKEIPTTFLTTNFRSIKKKCAIVDNCTRILEGRPLKEGKNCLFMPGACNDVMEILKMMKKKGMKKEDFYILSPTNKPLDELNRKCQQLWTNNNPSFIDKKDREWRVGDRVMVTVNNNDDGVYNGDELTIVAFDDPWVVMSIQETEVNENGVRVNSHREIKYLMDYRYKKKERFDSDFDEEIPTASKSLSDLTLSYAVTINKAQGDEKKVIILIIPSNAYPGKFMNSRRLYTGFSRAQELLFVICDEKKLSEIAARSATGRYDIIAPLIKQLARRKRKQLKSL